AAAVRIVPAGARSGVRHAEPRRHARASVRPGSGDAKRRTRNWLRRFSTGTAIDGSSVTPVRRRSPASRSKD
ncbi:MAG TPA: hypothetical protein VG222_05550, partial [Vicinamibacterales bacterium]|nr:hypothetical protein [Vicinamibacterales bacterium]